MSPLTLDEQVQMLKKKVTVLEWTLVFTFALSCAVGYGLFRTASVNAETTRTIVTVAESTAVVIGRRLDRQDEMILKVAAAAARQAQQNRPRTWLDP